MILLSNRTGDESAVHPPATRPFARASSADRGLPCFRFRPLLAWILLLAGSSVPTIRAQNELTPGALDISFPAGSGPDGFVAAVHSLPDGGWLIAGGFTSVDGQPAPGLARLRGNGSFDESFHPRLPVTESGRFAGLLVQPNGDIVVRGNGLIRLRADGTQDLGFQPAAVLSGITASPLPAIYVWGNGIARLRPDGTSDEAFAGRISKFELGVDSLLNARIRRVLALDDGGVVVAGDFNRVNGSPSDGFERLTARGDRHPWFSPTLNGSSVEDLAQDGAGHLYIANAAANPASSVVLRRNVDGSADPGFTGAIAFTAPSKGAMEPVAVSRVVPLPDGKILVCGAFEKAADQPRRHLARLNPDGSLDTTFDAGSGFSGSSFSVTGAGRVRVLEQVVVQPDGRLVIAGAFVGAQGSSRSYLARLQGGEKNGPPTVYAQPDTRSVQEYTSAEFSVGASSFEPPRFQWFHEEIAISGGTNATLKLGTVRLADAGDYRVEVSNSRGTTSSQAARLAVAAGSIPRINLATEPIAAIAGARLSMTATVAGVPTPSLQWFRDQTPILGATQSTLTLEDLRVTHSGSYTLQASNALGTVGSGSVLLTVTPPPRLPGRRDPSLSLPSLASALWTVTTVVRDAQGRILVPGPIESGSAVLQRKITRLLPDGSVDPTFDVGTGPGDGLYFALVSGYSTDTGIDALAVTAGGRILVAGNFRKFNGIPAAGVVRLLDDGSVDTTFQATPGAEGDRWAEVFALHSLPDGRVLAGGSFTSLHGTPRARLARIQASGPLDADFDVGSGAELGTIGYTTRLVPYDLTSVQHMATLADGRILAGGDFSRFQGAERPGLVVLSSTGSLDPATPRLLPGTTSALAVDPDGRWLVARTDTQANGVYVGAILQRLQPDGQQDPAFHPPRFTHGPYASSGIHALAVDSGGRVYVGGGFVVESSGQRRVSIARLLEDGTLDPTWGGSEGVRGSVRSMLLEPDGSLVIAGAFDQVDGVPAAGLARLYGDQAPPLRITSVRQVLEHLEVTVPTLAGRHYTLERRDPQAASAWTPLPGSLVGDGTLAVLRTTTDRAPAAFYRVRSE